MGAGCAAILAGFGKVRLYALARDLEKAKKGIAKAAASIRSETILERMIPGSYDQDLEQAVSESDWVFECVAESYDIKEVLNRKIGAARSPGTLVSTVSSGLSISRLADCFDQDGKKYYYGTHFFNPPYKLPLCELVIHKANDRQYTKELAKYMQKVLLRQVVITNDTPAFAGNRIGFQQMNEAALLAEKYQEQGGIYFIDSLLGSYSGRAMSPLATIDLVGLDVHKAIVNNIYQSSHDMAHETFRLPNYFETLIAKGALGNKTGAGLYKKEETADGKKRQLVYDIKSGEYTPPPEIKLPFRNAMIHCLQNSDYRGAFSILLKAEGSEAELLRHFIARYISYSFSLIPEVTDHLGIDKAMGFGFNWLPPSAWVDLLGGRSAACRFLEKEKMVAPPFLKNFPEERLYQLQNTLDWRSLLKAA